tara:strand:- start:776 stop:937 length:162 start_codon:yes stop_codon:yes gene_type:complete
MEEKLELLKELRDKQVKCNGEDDYMRGMANGVILSTAIMEGDENPKFITEEVE